jgi:hypothetical protein
MGPVVTIVLTGLALIDNRTYATTHREAHLLLVQRTYTAPSTFYDGVVVPKHVAFIMFDMKQLSSTPGNRKPTIKVAGPDNAEFGVVLMRDGVGVTMQYTQPLPLLPTPLDVSLCIPDTEPKICVPTLKSVCPGCDTRLDPGSPSIGASVHLKQGVLNVDGHEQYRALWCVESESDFRGCRIMPQQLRLKETASAVTFTFGDRSSPLTLAYQDAHGVYQDVDVLMGSVPLEELLGEHETHQGVDHHFEAYYDLIDGEVPLRPAVPVKVQGDRSPYGHQGVIPLFVHSGNCPPLSIR